MTSPPILVAHGRHFLVGNKVYTSLRRDLHIPPHIPHPEDSPDPSSLNLRQICNLGWVNNKIPFMMLVPLYKSFYGPLFSRLQYNSRNIPIVEHEDASWSLNVEVIQEWDTLERNLRSILSAMLSFSTARLPQLFQFWTFPMRYGYKLAYHTYDRARFIALRSRDAFMPLMAAISYMFLLMRWEEMRREDFNWRDKILAKTGIHHQWLADLESSAVGDFDAPKVGGIIRIDACEFTSFLSFIMSQVKDLPIYIYWGAILSRPLRPPTFLTDDMVPGHSEINHLRSLRLVAGAKKSSVPSNRILATPSPVAVSTPTSDMQHTNRTVTATSTCPVVDNAHPPPTKKFPPVELYSGQHQDEDWRSFFARRQEEDDRRAQRETAQQKQSRMARIEHAHKAGVPGRKGARVYVWEDIDGFLVRKAAGRKHYALIWGDFSSTQRRYDSFRDEWDLCENFDPTGQTGDDWDNGDGEEYEYHDSPLLEEKMDDQLPVGVYSSEADLRRVHDTQNHEVPLDKTNLLNECLHDLSSYRFGFMNPVGTVAEPSKKPDWRMVCKWLGNATDETCARPSRPIVDLLCTFFGYLSSAKSLSDIPRDMYDLRSEEIIFEKVCIRREDLSNQIYYVISSNTPEPDAFQFVLTSAASALEVVRRQWGPDIMSIGSGLLEKGIAFNLCYKGVPHLPAKPKFVPRFTGLGYRPAHYTPDIIDYAAYESSRDRFLQSARGRAALLRGGIIARLASEVVGYDCVYSGPSDEAWDQGICLWDQSPLSLAYIDDELTDDEVDLICGVYRVDSGQSHPTQGRQTIDISWWPKPTAWENSGLNVGYWSRDCEAWFQKRLETIKSGKADLRTQQQWKHGIKFTKSANLTSQKNEILASQWFAKISTTSST